MDCDNFPGVFLLICSPPVPDRNVRSQLGALLAFSNFGTVDALGAECVAAGSEPADPDGRREPIRGDLTVTKRPDPFDRFQKAARALAGLITALTPFLLVGHSIGWW